MLMNHGDGNVYGKNYDIVIVDEDDDDDDNDINHKHDIDEDSDDIFFTLSTSYGGENIIHVGAATNAIPLKKRWSKSDAGDILNTQLLQIFTT